MGKLQGKQWHPNPDILVHPAAGHDLLSSFDVKTYGVPPFVIEVASPSTWECDVGSKANAYGYVGVQEYLVFDPTTDLLGTPVVARHQTPDGFKPWDPDADGRWHSDVLPIALQVEGPLLRVLDEDGERFPTFTEQTHQLGAHTRQLDEQARRINEQERLLREQAQRIADLEAALRGMQDQA